MKTIKIIICTLLMAIPSAGFAQLFSGNTSEKKMAEIANNKDFAEIRAGFQNTTGSYQHTGAKESFSLAGFEFALDYNINITGKKAPLFLDLGFSMSANFGSKTFDSGRKRDINYLPYNFNTDLKYVYSINNKVAIAPRLGLNYKMNMMAFANYNGTSYNLMADKVNHEVHPLFTGCKGKFFQLGTNLGVDVYIGHILVGWTLQKDFSPIFNEEGLDTKITGMQNNISIGYRF